MVRAAGWAAFAAVMALGATNAWAQQQEQQPQEGDYFGGDPEESRQPPAQQQQPVPPPPPPGEPRAGVVVHHHEHERRGHASRPDVFTIGLGLGYDLPAGLDRPDVATAWFRLASGLTFEPTLRLEGTSSTTAITIPGPNPDDTSNGAFGITVGSNVRLPLSGRGPFDLVLLGGLELSYESTDPDGDDNDQSAFGVGVNWGLGIDWWLSRHWAVSFSATNPVFAFVNQSQDTGPGSSTSTDTFLFGAIWDPNFVLTAHMFW
jgi:hypothetical protein